MKREAPRAQGIHSVFVAFLGETGTLGFAALLLAAALIAAHAWKKTQDTADKSWGIMLFGALMLMAVGGIVQDFFYQRVFWFVLGLGSAEGMNEKSDLLIDRIYLATVILFGLVVFGITLK